MNKEDILSELERNRDALATLRNEVQASSAVRIRKTDTRNNATQLCRRWFDVVEPLLPAYGVERGIIEKYHESFVQILRLAFNRDSAKVRYLTVLDVVLGGFKTDLVLSVIQSGVQTTLKGTQYESILEKTSEDEKDYLKEALGCATNGFKRASVVLAWCAAVQRMHKTVEALGFDAFNTKSEEMKKITEGRYKRFNKSFSVHSMNELSATVFDGDLLWVLEYWGLIDSNQHERLSLCFTMRNNAAHPGEAPITEENLASFYSDLKLFVFDNSKLQPGFRPHDA